MLAPHVASPTLTAIPTLPAIRSTDSPRMTARRSPKPVGPHVALGRASDSVASKGSILVVEDDPDIRRLVQFVLDDIGFDVATAANGPTAIERARADSPDLVLLDFILPGEDGEAVAGQLRGICGDIPILLMSAADDLENKAHLVGAVDRLDKPFELSDLVESVSRAMRVASLATRPHRTREEVQAPSGEPASGANRTEWLGGERPSTSATMSPNP